ncbi:Arc family DNA-binding protein [Rhizobium sp. SG741]|uniref:Arc family DNA-binding protein n=1 Tax=Rhizobium sp. SG741 TaxID=2587114 RepID=UPI001445BDC5|nr:Arc family DNA-binding protein [Rhizobium sp. SG741]NKJ03451.1 hypothetical protein [Rhizobium sp. SG741]
MGRPSRASDQFIVRLPDGLRDRIKSAAEANNRSMNAEIVATLEEAYPAPPNALFEFVKKFVDPISQESDPKRIWVLTDIANAFLEGDGSELRLIPIIAKSGKNAVTFVDAHFLRNFDAGLAPDSAFRVLGRPNIDANSANRPTED